MIYIKYVVSDENCKLRSEDIYSARDLLLFKAFGLKDAKSLIKVSKDGKPYIENAQFNFSISDTDNAAVVAACGNGVIVDGTLCIDIKAKRIGVDIECAEREINEKSMLNIANRYFTGQEISYLKNTNQSIKQNFLEIWTKKESIVKATGEGLKALNNADAFSSKYIIQTSHIYLNKKPYIVSFAAI